MKKILLILLLIFSSCFAKIQKPSPIPPASLYYLDFEPGICDSQCLKKLIDEKKDFSFYQDILRSIQIPILKATI